MTDALTDNILVLVRHGESEWNRLNLFTGWRNPDLTEKGVIEARVAGRMIRDNGVKFDIAFTSVLKRAQHTLDIILAELPAVAQRALCFATRCIDARARLLRSKIRHIDVYRRPDSAECGVCLP